MWPILFVTQVVIYFILSLELPYRYLGRYYFGDVFFLTFVFTCLVALGSSSGYIHINFMTSGTTLHPQVFLQNLFITEIKKIQTTFDIWTSKFFELVGVHILRSSFKMIPYYIDLPNFISLWEVSSVSFFLIFQNDRRNLTRYKLRCVVPEPFGILCLQPQETLISCNKMKGST